MKSTFLFGKYHGIMENPNKPSIFSKRKKTQFQGWPSEVDYFSFSVIKLKKKLTKKST